MNGGEYSKVYKMKKKPFRIIIFLPHRKKKPTLNSGILMNSTTIHIIFWPVEYHPNEKKKILLLLFEFM